MVADGTTFFLAFTALFGAVLLYLWRLEQIAKRLEMRVTALAARNEKGPRH